MLLSMVAAPALAQSGAFEVPARCGARDEFESSIRARSGDREAEAILASLSLWIREQPGTYALTMQVGAETRHLQDADCSQLLRTAVVVAIALWEAPSRSAAPSDASEVTALPAAGERASVNAAPPRPLPAAGHVLGPLGVVNIFPTVHPRRLKVLLGIELGASAGLQPDVGLLGGVRGGVELGRFGVHGSLRWLPPRSERDANNRGVDVAVMSARVGGSYNPLESIAIDFGVSGHSLSGSGLGSSQVASATLWTFGPALGLRATAVQWGSAFLQIAAEGHLALVRPRFEITDYAAVFRVPLLHGATFLVAGYRFQ